MHLPLAPLKFVLSSGASLTLIVNIQYPDILGQAIEGLIVSFTVCRRAVALLGTVAKYRWAVETEKSTQVQKSNRSKG